MRAMIDDDLVQAHRQRALIARPAGHSRHGAEPRRVFPGPRSGEPVLPGRARHRAERRWTSSPRSPAGSITCSTTWARRMPSASSSIMGSACRQRSKKTVLHLNAQGEKVGAAEGAPVSAILGRAFRRRPAQDGEDDRCARPHARNLAAPASRCIRMW